MVKKSSASYRMGIDLGGTKILAAVVDASGAIVGETAMGRRFAAASILPSAAAKSSG